MTVEDIEKAVESLSPDKLTQFRAWFEEFESRHNPYYPTEEELAGIDRGLRAAAEGKFATDEQVEAVFAKFRGV
ncbi:MAG TPA: hypothetical protein VK779_07445 [Rhizomicrobium sp.]|jgi:predicted transcriptional regulator|nr:hypothetical protein [Rhizomicrobium sp.]